ncbi:MAG: polysaccharide biosynthesis C-terminal domain-containing protein [Firmicutes bacterium]|nr:polysaccharide biosynthesis C-terminal domain-containing protein [Bacillota bacterium]
MRNGKILNKKFFQFLLPTSLSIVAMSLNEFVDALLVANLIDSDAMTLVNMGTPLVFIFAVIYALLGVGGSTLYAGYLGRYEIKKAEKIFTVTMLAALFISLAVLIFGFVFIDFLSGLMCKAPEYSTIFKQYIRVLIVSSVLIIPIQVLISFMPSFGRPGVGTFINITANVVNLIMDYVYIRFFATGLSGAAYATLTGYAVGAVIIFVLYIMGKLQLPFAKISLKDLCELKEAIAVGLSPAANQVGYCIKVSFSNHVAFALAGMAGTTVYSLCMQVVSIISIFIGGVIDAAVPIASSLYGQRDFSGVRLLMKTAIWVQFITTILCFAVIEVWPQGVLAMYNVSGDMTPLAINGLRIFTVMFLFRGFTLVYIYYFPIIGRKIYAFVISLTDGFLGLIPLILILTMLNGINGLWQAYALLSILLVFGIVVVNIIISIRSKGKYSKLLLLEHEDENIPVYECSINAINKDVSELSKNIQTFCEDHGTEQKLSLLTALSVEEMSVFTIEQNKNSHIDQIDILLKIYPEYILMDFRSIGTPFDISATTEEYSNMDILKKIVTDMEYNYVLGMNQTRLKYNRQYS